MTTLKTVEEVTQSLPQAILGAMEYRGFYDCGKYLDEDVLEPIVKTITQDRADILRVLVEGLEKIAVGVDARDRRWIELPDAINFITTTLTDNN